MIFIANHCCDPFFNISCEEFLFTHFIDECAMLWRSSPSIIVGKHQNTLAEINYDFANKNNIPVIRRLSGGGTVYHDPGNINFTFITNRISDNAIHFSKYLNPVIDILNTLSVSATINPRNNIFIGNKKVSGTAAHLAKNKVMHHGTLLFKSSVIDIDKALKVDSQKYSDKSIKSVHSPVTNVDDYLNDKIEITEFMKLLERKIKQEFAINTDYLFQENDLKIIEHLVETKYKTWEWNYGYSPSYKFNNSAIFGDITINIELQVKKGIVEFISLSNDISTINKSLIEEAIIGTPHEIVQIQKALASFNFSTITNEKLIRNFF